MKKISFNFGKNWLNYSKGILDEERFNQAKNSLIDLIGKENIVGKSFLDVGSGSGIFSLAAVEIGASKVIGFDISKESIECANINSQKFNIKNKVEFFQQSIFEDDFKKFGKFDVVYSWGVLHHTGDMWQTIKNSMALVNNEGLLVIAIYNKHWSSHIWKKIKYFYNISPRVLKKVMTFIFYCLFLITKFLITFKNPFKQKRGMDFYYDVVDWLGGYPYDYATKDEINNFISQHGFKLIKFEKFSVPTGCNEFVFKKCNNLKYYD